MISNVVEGELWVDISPVTGVCKRLLCLQVKLYPIISPFWLILSGGIHVNKTLCGRNVVFVQLTGGATGTINYTN